MDYLMCFMLHTLNREDRERIVDEIKSLFFNTLYLWTTDFVSPLVISYHDFIVLFAPTN
jgi:hypothetical protein